MRLGFIPNAYHGRSDAFESQRFINLYSELSAGSNQKGIGMLIGAPGKRLFSSGLASAVRGSIGFNGLIYAVESNKLVSIDSAGAVTVLGSLATSTGRVSMSQNGLLSAGIGGNQVMVVDGVNGYVYNVVTAVFTTIAGGTGGFPVTPQQIEYSDGYFIVTNGTMSASASNLYDGTTWNALATTPVQSASDNVQGLLNLHEQLFFIKQYTSEVYYNNGTATAVGFPYSRMQGAVIDYGAVTPWTIARGNNSAFFLANERDGDGNTCFVGVVELSGYTPTPITPPSIVYKMSKSTDLTQCFGFCYSAEGHTFYQITNPVDDWTFVYDTTTQMWHERSTANNADDSVHRDRANCYVNAFGLNLVGDVYSGNLYEVNSKFNTDCGMPIICEQITQHLIDGQTLDDLFVDELQIDMEVGVGRNDVNAPATAVAVLAGGGVSSVTVTYNGADYITTPTVLLQSTDGNGTGATATATVANGSVTSVTVTAAGTGYTAAPLVVFAVPAVTPSVGLSRSKDGGRTWGPEHTRSMGAIGQYRQRVLYRSLGRCKDLVFRLRISSPVKRIIMGWYAEGSR